MQNKIWKLYQKLYQRYGSPSGQWSLWCKRPKSQKEKEEVIIATILTQRTNWKNVELSLEQLKKEGCDSLKLIYHLAKKDIHQLEKLIRPCGFYRTKAQYLFGLIKFILEKYKSLKGVDKIPLARLRTELLSLKGIGPETADSILLYALERPIFVIDEYTRRLVKKLNWTSDLSYHSLQEFFESHLKKDFRLFQDFHALIVIDGKHQ